MFYTSQFVDKLYAFGGLEVEIKYLVKHVASKELVTVDKDKRSKEVVDVMLANDIGCVIVTENGKPIGLVTDRDVIKSGGLLEGKNFSVGTYMSTPLVTIDSDAPTGKAAEVMMDKNIRRLIVVENEEIVGIVTQKDLLKGSISAYHMIQLMGM
jgi:CBS domain-containing protein